MHLTRARDIKHFFKLAKKNSGSKLIFKFHKRRIQKNRVLKTDKIKEKNKRKSLKNQDFEVEKTYLKNDQSIRLKTSKTNTATEKFPKLTKPSQ